MIEVARDGHTVWVQGPLPRYRRPQRKELDTEMREKVRKKLDSVTSKRYIDKISVESLTSYFAVPKGTSDIRMVYDATVSGLNRAKCCVI